MKSNFRITGTARCISLSLVLCMLLCACGSADSGNPSVGDNTQGVVTEDDSDVTVEGGDSNNVGSSEMPDEKLLPMTAVLPVL